MAFKQANPNGRTFRERYPQRLAARGSHNGYFTDAYLLAEVLRPLIEREGATLSADHYGNKNGSDGGRLVLAERASIELGIEPLSVYRRIYEILHDYQTSIKIETAEALVVAAGELFLNLPLPTMPGKKKAALEMAEAWADEDDDVEELAHRLLRFSIGFHAGEEITDPEEFAARVDRRNAAKRKHREKQSEAVS